MSEINKNQHLSEGGNPGFTIQIHNKTIFTLSLRSSSCVSGSYSISPATTIAPGELIKVSGNGADGTATRVTPVWTYAIEGTEATMTWNIDIPYSGAGSGSVYVNSGFISNLLVNTNPTFQPHCDVWDATTVVYID